MPAELNLFIPFWTLKVMKSVKTSYKNQKKRQSTNTIQFLDCKKPRALQYSYAQLTDSQLQKALLDLFKIDIRY